jgi:hypothetical protein
MKCRAMKKLMNSPHETHLSDQIIINPLSSRLYHSLIYCKLKAKSITSLMLQSLSNTLLEIVLLCFYPEFSTRKTISRSK